MMNLFHSYTDAFAGISWYGNLHDGSSAAPADMVQEPY